jgi:hypothetical protein
MMCLHGSSIRQSRASHASGSSTRFSCQFRSEPGRLAGRDGVSSNFRLPNMSSSAIVCARDAPQRLWAYDGPAYESTGRNAEGEQEGEQLISHFDAQPTLLNELTTAIRTARFEIGYGLCCASKVLKKDAMRSSAPMTGVAWMSALGLL